MNFGGGPITVPSLPEYMGLLEVPFSNIPIRDEIADWYRSILVGKSINNYRCDIGPFIGLFPCQFDNEIVCEKIISESITFNMDYHDPDKLHNKESWKGWFIL